MSDNIRPVIRVVYTHFPHYRQPVFDALSRSTRYTFKFHYDPVGITKTIASGTGNRANHYSLKTRVLGPLQWQIGAVSLALAGRSDAFIFLGNPFIVSTWIAALIAKARGKAVFFWTHGWVRDEVGAKDWLRRTFYGLADALMLYADRAKQLALKRGLDERALYVIGNSLDYAAQAATRHTLLAGSAWPVHKRPEKPFFLVVSRLVPSARIDLAIAALAQTQHDAALVVIGEGPERAALEAQAKTCGADVHFTGALYSEEDLAPYFLDCLAVVSPGKVGLLAMHALAYGALVITHGDPDRQMPEFEAIEDGVTGILFNLDEESDLGEKIASLLANPPNDDQVTQRRARAIATIEEGYTPESQVERIEAALIAHGVGEDV